MPFRPRPWRVILCLVCLLAPCVAQAAPYLDELIGRSRELRLSERREWHRLMHYVPNLLTPGVHGLADARRFYLAPDGKTNPQSELEATLAAFFSDVQETDKEQNPQCAFIARYHWIDRQLGFDPARLPRQPCRRFREWRDTLNPQGVTLIFPAAYINNPSSMYGHTLLRIDAKDQDEKTRLLAYAINYAANTNETNGIAFAINGLFGGYPGTFSIMPYYLKVREYNDMENRDIWEYELNLSPEEIDRVLMHAWELGPIYFDYYFFDENCSYYLLELLEAARPDLDLTSSFRWWAIPSDTVREVVEQKGLVRKTVYRPSNATVILHRLGLMRPDERAFVTPLARGRIPVGDPSLAALAPSDRARVLEVSHDYLSYLHATGKSPLEQPEILARDLLLERSRIGPTPSDPPVPVPEVRPDQGHGTSRVGIGGGRRDGANFVELRARPTYHDLMDPDAGYVPGAQIEFFDFAIRDYSGGVGARVEDITPVRIVSISPRNEFFQPLSWKIDVGWARRRLASGAEPLVFGVHGGPGFAWTVPDTLRSKTMVYAFLESTLQADTRLENNYAVGIGPGVGALIDFTDRWRAEPYAREQSFFAGDTDTAWTVGLRQRYTLDRDWALRLDLSRERQEKQSWNTVLLSLHHYF
jgi:subtilisin family serine protease